MINQINLQKETSDTSIKKNSASKAKQPAQATKSLPSVSRPALAGLPADKLSASIVSFARFFSLPLKPQMLADIRRQAFFSQPVNPQSAAQQPAQTAQQTAQPGSQPSSANPNVSRETFPLSNVLAVSSAESKGVELQAKGIELYAEVIDPEREQRQDGDKQRKQQNKEQNETNINAESIKKLALENAENNPLLEILNKLPGKNGQRWIVLPFGFCQNGIEYKVSMRVLLDSPTRANCMALDIAKYEEETGELKRDWLMVMESVNEKPHKLTVYFSSDLKSDSQEKLQTLKLESHEKIKNDLAKQLAIPAERIVIKLSDEPFPFEADNEGQSTFIDEAV